MDHPLITILFDITAGTAGLNLVAFGFYLTIALLAALWLIERSFKQ